MFSTCPSRKTTTAWPCGTLLASKSQWFRHQVMTVSAGGLRYFSWWALSAALGGSGGPHVQRGVGLVVDVDRTVEHVRRLQELRVERAHDEVRGARNHDGVERERILAPGILVERHRLRNLVQVVHALGLADAL